MGPEAVIPGAIIGVVEALKRIGLPTSYAPVLSIALGILAWILVGTTGQDMFLKVLEGAGLGALAPAAVFIASRIGQRAP